MAQQGRGSATWQAQVQHSTLGWCAPSYCLINTAAETAEVWVKINVLVCFLMLWLWPWPKASWGRKSLIYLKFSYHSPQMRDVKAEVQGRHLEAGVHREAAEDTASWHVLPDSSGCFLMAPRTSCSQWLSPSTLIVWQENAPQLYLQGNLAGACVQLEPPFSDD